MRLLLGNSIWATLPRERSTIPLQLLLNELINLRHLRLIAKLFGLAL